MTDAHHGHRGPPTLGTTLREQRLARGWTLRDLAERISVRPSIVEGFETGRERPGSEVLRRLEEILDVDVRTWEPFGRRTRAEP